jgi:hypothetical protein
VLATCNDICALHCGGLTSPQEMHTPEALTGARGHACSLPLSVFEPVTGQWRWPCRVPPLPAFYSLRFKAPSRCLRPGAIDFVVWSLGQLQKKCAKLHTFVRREQCNGMRRTAKQSKVKTYPKRGNCTRSAPAGLGRTQAACAPYTLSSPHPVTAADGRGGVSAFLRVFLSGG